MAEQPKQPVPTQVDDSNAVSCYANFCRVTGSAEELIVDFGMNTQPVNNSDSSVAVQQRVVMNFYTAKRLLHALHVSVRRHEEVFGDCLLYTSPSPRDRTRSRMPSSA